MPEDKSRQTLVRSNTLPSTITQQSSFVLCFATSSAVYSPDLPALASSFGGGGGAEVAAGVSTAALLLSSFLAGAAPDDVEGVGVEVEVEVEAV